MSGKWAEFDPLSRARAKPAAPITSMEQAEVKPTISKPSSRRSEPSSPTAIESTIPNDSTNTELSQSEANTSKAKSIEPPLPQSGGKPAEPSETIQDEKLLPEASSGQGERDDTSDLTAPAAEKGKHADQDVKQEESGEADAASESVVPAASTTLKPTTEAAAEAAAGTKTEPEVATRDTSEDPSTQLAPEDPEKPGTEQAPTQTERSAIIPEAGVDESTGDADSSDAKEISADTVPPSSEASNEWPTKLKLNETDAEPHHGDLRKNSIAAMKELGSPDARVSSAAPPEEDLPFDFQRFMALLRSRNADPIARYVKSFLQEFSRGVWSPTQQEKIVSDFQKFIGVKMREFEPFASLNKSDRRNAAEGMEKLVMNRLYTRTFPPKMPPILRSDGHNEDLLRDQVFEEKLRLWGWVEGRHLDINEGYLQSGFIQLAANELTRLHQFKSPRDKTICVLNCSKVVWALIRQAKLEQNADSFLPLLIYVVIKAQPAYLISNLNYIQRFRSREFLKGETAYYLSTLASAATFIETLDKSSLTISDEEFDQKMEESIRTENQRQRDQQQEQHAQHHNDSSQSDSDGHEGESSAAVLAASAGMLVERMRNFTSKFLDDLSTPEENDSQDRGHGTNTDSTEQQRLASEARRQYRDEEQAAREASREEFRTEQLQRQQFDETSATLQQMFPTLDEEVIKDVLHQCGTNIGSAVDLCLALVGTT